MFLETKVRDKMRMPVASGNAGFHSYSNNIVNSGGSQLDQENCYSSIVSKCLGCNRTNTQLQTQTNLQHQSPLAQADNYFRNSQFFVTPTPTQTSTLTYTNTTSNTSVEK